MDTPEHELEQFIHQQLKKLPEREAPENLAANVFAAIAARKNSPWWKQPFTYWPRDTQTVLFTMLSGVFAAVVYFTWRPAEALSEVALTEKASAFAWVGRFVESIGMMALSVLRGLSWQWFLAIGLVFLVLYAACVATGFALYRITARPASSAA